MKKKTPRNKFELDTYKFLKKKKVRFTYEAEKLSYLIAGHYTPDFILLSNTSESRIIVETKGYFRPEDKRKLAAVKKLHPTVDIRLLFYPFKSAKIEKQYTKWADKHGFKWAIGKIPQEWIDELR